jgi:signal transduction histidine kinase/CheY-like chemotaxis protein
MQDDSAAGGIAEEDPSLFFPMPDPSKTREERLEARLAQLSKISTALIRRVERGMDYHQENAYSLFKMAITLEEQVSIRTEQLQSAMCDLEQSSHNLAQAKEIAEHASETKRRFLAAVSHDLLQPLSAARLSTSILRDTPLNDECSELVEQVYRCLITLENILRTLLDISKLEAGAIKPEISEFPLSDFLNGLRKEYMPAADRKRLRFRLLDTSLSVRSDPVLLRRILQNFLSNAIRYTQKGGVVLGCRRRGDKLRIEVWDTGVGIAQPDERRIFEEFYRGKRKAAAGDGMGLGLSIVKHVAAVLGHTIDFRSVEGRGSMFCVTLPLSESARHGEVGRKEMRLPGCTFSGMTVVLIENDREVMFAMNKLLRRWGCTTACGDTARAVLETEELRSGKAPDLILLDYHLDDDRTGLDELEILWQKFGRKTPAIVVTADYTSRVEREAQREGLVLVTKPVKPAELRAAMAHAVFLSPGK